MPNDDLKTASTEATTLPEAEFLRRHPMPAVLCYRSPEDAADEDAQMNPRTALILRPDSGQGRRVEALFFLQKAAETGFSHMVTVGRTRRADIPLVSEKVSKVHAYFTWSEGRDTYFITDGNSTNGTRVNGVAILPRQATLLRDLATIQVGDFDLKFMSPKTLYRFLKGQR